MTTTPLRRLRHLDEETCWDRLASVTTARLAYVVDGRPRIVPVNPVVRDGSIHVRTMRGTRLSQLLQGADMPVSLEADELAPDQRAGWSVVAHGHLVPVLDTVAVAHAARDAADPWVIDARDAYWGRLVVDEIGGRELVH